jgi:LacI family transcriptional regulator
MTDVARRAGVSQTTASFVINNRQAELRISEATRKRVLEAARDLNYRRNELARAVGSGKNFVIGFAKEQGIAELEWRILEGVLKAAYDAGYMLKVLLRDYQDTDYASLARQCVEQRLAGLVCRTFSHAQVTEALRQELDHARIPIAFVDDKLELPGTTCVSSDDEMGCRQLVEHIVALGHTRIALLAGDTIHPQSVMRTTTILNLLSGCGIDVRPDWLTECGWSLERAAAITHDLFRNLGEHPTALLCDGDEIAAVAIHVIVQCGLRIPADVSVVGFGDFKFAKLLSPPLTTISQPFEEIGSKATQILLARLDEGSDATVPPQVLLPTKLVIRSSTAHARNQ